MLPPLKGQVSHHWRFSGHKHIVFGMCVIIFLENRTEAPLWPNSQRVQDVPGSALWQEFQLECLVRACERPELDVFVSCRGRETKWHSFVFETDKKRCGEQSVVVSPPTIQGAESCGIQSVRVSAPECTKSTCLTSSSRFYLLICA